MRIIKSKSIEERSDRIILVRKDGDLAAHVPQTGTSHYVEDRFEERKRILPYLNQLDHHLFVSSWTRERIQQRTAGWKRRGKRPMPFIAVLNDMGYEKVDIINGGVTAEECIAFAEGLALTNYQFLKYKTGRERKRKEIRTERDPDI